MSDIDTKAARRQMARLDTTIGSMAFTAPEVMNERQQQAAEALNAIAVALGLVGRIEVVAHDSLTMESAKKHLEGAYALRHRESCYQLAAGRDIVMESTPTIDSIDAWIDLLTQMTGGTR